MQQKEISIKYAIIVIKGWKIYFWSKWLYFLIIGIVFAGLGILYAFISKPVYTATSTFVLANSSESGGQILGLANQFGIDLGGTGNDIFTGDNIIALMKSRRMIQEAMMKKPPNKDSTLLNIYCVFNNLPEGWKINERTASVFPFPDSLDALSPVQDSLFREIYTNISTDYLNINEPEENQAIYKVTTISKNETFSYYLTKYIVEVTSSFYIHTKTKTSKDNLGMLNHEADSLRQLLRGAITGAASANDAVYNLNPAYQVQRSPSQQSQAQAEVLGAAYGEVIKNLEIAKITLQKETPLYQIIDEPVLPLVRETKSKLIYMILGGIISCIITAGFLVIKKYNAEI